MREGHRCITKPCHPLVYHLLTRLLLLPARICIAAYFHPLLSPGCILLCLSLPGSAAFNIWLGVVMPGRGGGCLDSQAIWRSVFVSMFHVYLCLRLSDTVRLSLYKSLLFRLNAFVFVYTCIWILYAYLSACVSFVVFVILLCRLCFLCLCRCLSAPISLQ